MSPPNSARLLELGRRFDEWQKLPYPGQQYPPGAAEAEILGVDLALLDGDAAYVVAALLDPKIRQLANEEVLREHSLANLQRVLPHLTGHASVYFGQLLDLVRTVDDIARERESDSG